MIKKRKTTTDLINNALKYTGKVKLSSMYGIVDYVPYNPNRDLKKWCVESALRVTNVNDDGNTVQPDVIKTAQQIYDWVTK